MGEIFNKPRMYFNAKMSFEGSATSVEHLQDFLSRFPGTHLVKIEVHNGGNTTVLQVSEEG